MLISCYQAIVMMVQNRYQRRRMYTRIALGKNSAMDVVSGESSGSRGQLLLLYPLLFGEVWSGMGLWSAFVCARMCVCSRVCILGACATVCVCVCNACVHARLGM